MNGFHGNILRIEKPSDSEDWAQANKSDEIVPVDTPAPCGKIFQPVVCGIYDEQYNNRCIAKHVGGYNKEDCKNQLNTSGTMMGVDISAPCGKLFQPVVCGIDDQKFNNRCHAIRDGGYKNKECRDQK